MDLANYVLLRNAGFLDQEKNKFTLYGDLAGLSRDDYLAKLDKAYTAVQNDVLKDYDESFETKKIDKEIKLGDWLIAKFKEVLIIKKRDTAYSGEPIKPDKPATDEKE